MCRSATGSGGKRPTDYSPLTMLVRHADPARDAAACAAIYAPFVESSATSFEEVAPDAAEFARRIERLAGSHAFLVVEDERGVSGFAYGSPHRERAAYRWTAEVSIYLGGRARGRGVGRAVYGELLGLLEAQGVCLALAGIALPNPSSVALHKACGFEPVGVYRGVGFKAGTWHDVGWWQRRLRPDDEPPAELGPQARLRQTPRQSSSSSSASVGHESAARRASPSSSGGTASVSRIG